jgi:hypothetical protein
MRPEPRWAVRLLVACSLNLALAAHADIATLPLPFKPVEIGHGTMRYFGLHIYDASLWSADRVWHPNAPYALELTYARNFKGAAIADRSIKEIKSQRMVDPATLARWGQQMKALFPDVKEGDRLTGEYKPGHGATFYLGDRLLGTIADDAFAAAFFDIWLSPKTSEPGLRAQLLGTR